MFQKIFNRVGAIVASLLFLAAPALAAELKIQGSQQEGVTIYSITIPKTALVNDFTAPIPACQNMVVWWEQGNSGAASLYPADSDDDTVGEITANTIINAFTTNERYGPFTPTKAAVRFVVDTVNATVVSTAKVLCSNLASSGGAGVQEYAFADFPTGGSPAVIIGTDCADAACNGGGGSTRVALYWDTVSYEPIAVAVSGITNPLTADLEASTFDANVNMGSPATSLNWPQLSLTNPATFPMGFGVTWGSDQVAKAYPTGPEIDTRNNLFGFFSNKGGVNGSISKQCAPAWDWSYETNFRTTSGTADDPWFELNLDLFPSEYTSVPTGVSGTFTTGEYVTFSGGGSGKVLSYSGGTLTFRQTTGDTCVANAQTVTGISSGATGTIASLTYVGQGTSAWTRALQVEWDQADNATTDANGQIRWVFDTLPIGDARPAAFRIKNSGVGIYLRDDVTRRLHVQNDGQWNTNALAFFEHDEATSTGLNQNADILELRHDYGANANTHSYARSIHVYSPLNGGSATVTRQHALHIEDMKAFGATDSSVIMIEPQTGGDGGDGNVTLEGGNYNSGHFTFGGEGAAGDHLWRSQTGERWRTKSNAIPTSATDGNALAEMVALNGTATMGTSLIASEACATVVTVAAPGVATTDVLSWGFNGDVTAVTGYAPVTSGALSIYAYPTANNVNFKVCNPTAGSITPTAITLNWNVVR